MVLYTSTRLHLQIAKHLSNIFNQNIHNYVFIASSWQLPIRRKWIRLLLYLVFCVWRGVRCDTTRRDAKCDGRREMWRRKWHNAMYARYMWHISEVIQTPIMSLHWVVTIVCKQWLQACNNITSILSVWKTLFIIWLRGLLNDYINHAIYRTLTHSFWNICILYLLKNFDTFMLLAASV